MDTLIRCHIKNQERLDGLERAIVSWKNKGLAAIGNLYLIDDTSPMAEEVRGLAAKHQVIFQAAGGTPDTKNGLYASLKFHRDTLGKNEPMLCCVDDVVFGKGIVERLQSIELKELPLLPRYALVGLFACYSNRSRSIDTQLWQIPTPILYALVCHVFSPQMRDLVIEDWEAVQSGTRPYPGCCDDIWVKELAIKHKLPCYNTLQDYAQHTGMGNRTFGTDDGGSTYISPLFVGE